MGYSNFKRLHQVSEKFGIVSRRARLFTHIEPQEPSEWLKESLRIAYTITLSNEKAKSERVISPILSEVHLRHRDTITLFSGEELTVNPDEDLSGACDFFFAASPDAYVLEAPIVALSEAKDEDLEWGIAQCSAQMIAAQRFNSQRGKPTPVVWGCATTAGEWKFLKLTESTLYVDEQSYFIDRLELLLGVFHVIISQL